MTAWLALVLSVLALAWNVLQLYIRWPRIGVVMRQSVFITFPVPQAPGQTPPTAGDKLHLIVVNSSAEAATIADVGVRSEDRSVTVDVERLRDQGKEVDGPELPARVEAHDALRWTVGYDLLDPFPIGTKMIGYAYRYRTLSKLWSRDPLRLKENVVPAIQPGSRGVGP